MPLHTFEVWAIALIAFFLLPVHGMLHSYYKHQRLTKAPGSAFVRTQPLTRKAAITRVVQCKSSGCSQYKDTRPKIQLHYWDWT